MANGDDAIAQGLRVFSDTQDLKEGYDNDNIRGDDVAHEIVRAKAAEATKLDASKIRVQQTDPGAVPDGTLWIAW